MSLRLMEEMMSLIWLATAVESYETSPVDLEMKLLLFYRMSSAHPSTNPLERDSSM